MNEWIPSSDLIRFDLMSYEDFFDAFNRLFMIKLKVEWRIFLGGFNDQKSRIRVELAMKRQVIACLMKKAGSA